MSIPTLLSPVQRTRLLAFPEEERDLVRHYTLSDTDRAMLVGKRGDQNRLGFALQLCCLRFPGQAFSASGGAEQIPLHVVEFVARQLGIEPQVFTAYARREETRREHLLELKSALGLRTFDAQAQQALSAWLLPVAMGTDKGVLLVETLLAEMRLRQIIIPNVTVVERLAEDVRRTARRETYRALLRGLTETHVKALEGVLVIRPDGEQSWLAWLRKASDGIGARSFLRLVERLEYIRALDVDMDRGRSIHRNRLVQLAREGSRSSVQHLAEYEPERRLATIVAVLLDLVETITDECIDIFDHMLGATFRKSERHYAERFQQSAKIINEKLRLYVAVGRALIKAREQAADPFNALDGVLPWERFLASVQEAEALARPEEFDPLEILGERYALVRRYAPTLLAVFEFQASSPAKPLMKAIDLLRELNTTGRRSLPKSPPSTFVKKRWKRLVFPNGTVDRRYYELCVLAELRDRLRAGDVWVTGSRRYRNFEEHLLPKATVAQMRFEGLLPLAVEPEFKDFIGNKQAILAETLQRVCARASEGLLPDVSLENGRLSVTPVKKSSPEEARELARVLYGMLPRVKITELLLEVDAWTGFTDQFTHLRTGLPPEDREALLSSILADGINLGLARMAEACKTVSLRRLTWTSDWHIRDESYGHALAQLIDFQHGHPFARHWGEGTTSSSDGQHYRAGGKGEAIGRVNARYGNDPGAMFYTHVSDQFGPYHVKVISATESEAPHVIDGLLYHDSSLEIQEHYTDTGGATEHIFALCSLLGFTFAPRIRDLRDRRLYVFGKAVNYPALSGLIAGSINTRHIEPQWEDILRLAASIKTGTVTASLILKKLAAYPRQNGLALALRELGRLERTLFTLRWLEDPDLRRKANLELNKGEARNALGRVVFFNRLGELRDRSYENQRYRASGLNLLTAAIIVWNTIYLDKAVEELRRQGAPIDESLLPHVAPLGWEHINLTGDYAWESPPEGVPSLRALRLSSLTGRSTP